MPDHTFSKVNLKYIQRTCPVVHARYSFHLPFSCNLQILLGPGNRASINVEVKKVKNAVVRFTLQVTFHIPS